MHLEASAEGLWGSVLVFAVGWGRQEHNPSRPPNMPMRELVQLAVWDSICVHKFSRCTIVTGSFSFVFCNYFAFFFCCWHAAVRAK